jgi:hypothetical protein
MTRVNLWLEKLLEIPGAWAPALGHWGYQSPLLKEAESEESSWLALAAFTSFSILEPQLTAMGPWHHEIRGKTSLQGHQKTAKIYV